MNNFEVVSRFLNDNTKRIPSLPKRATAHAAGYDFEAAEDIIVPSWYKLSKTFEDDSIPFLLSEVALLTKNLKIKPTLIPTGIKCKLDPGCYLEISVRSSLPLKHWLILANGVGIIDGDYYNNEDNEGEIYFQLINLSPFDIQLKAGDRIGQGIIKAYGLVQGDRYGLGQARIGGFGSTSTQQEPDLDNPFYQLNIDRDGYEYNYYPLLDISFDENSNVNQTTYTASGPVEYFDDSRL